jgi:uncharacterized protein DUF4383
VGSDVLTREIYRPFVVLLSLALPLPMSTSMETAAGRIAGVVGIVYMLVGIGGFVVGAAYSSHHVLVFQVTPLHNLAHLALGALLVVGASRGAESARQAMLVVGSVFLLLSVFGPLIMDMPMDVLGLNGADHLLHGATAIGLLGAAVLLGRRVPLQLES